MSLKVAIIGAGPGGYVAALHAARMGAEDTVIENDSIGGTCLNWGCIPSKVLIKSATLLKNIHRAAEFGIRLEGDVSLDMQRLMARKNKVIEDQRKGILALFTHQNIRYLNGFGHIEGMGRVSVKEAGGPQIEVNWDRLILATGTRPTTIPALPFDGDRIMSSNDALSLEAVPRSILIVGGGVIGCEFAFMLNALGADVILVEALDRLLPLPSVDSDCSKVLQREMKKRKIKFMVDRSVDDVNDAGDMLRVTIGPSPFISDGNKERVPPQTLAVEKILVCVGRQANTDNLGLENIGVPVDEKGWIGADERMQTGIEGVYAIGDILGPSKIMLAHVASTEGIVASENALGEKRLMHYTAVPGAIFTQPEVATVGLTEAQARGTHHNIRADTVLFRTLGKAQVIGEIAGQAKIISEADSGIILGVHIVGPHATDLIAEATLALENKNTVKDLASTIHAHPTLSEIMMEASFKALDRSLHG